MPETLTAPRRDGATQPQLRSAGIAGIGAAMPERRLTSAEIAAPLGIDESWILTRTGVRERRVLAEHGTVTDLAAEASRAALADAGMEADELDWILFATTTPDRLQPHAAPELAARLEATDVAPVDVGAACCGFVSALSLATGMIETGRAEHVLVVGAEAMSRVLDYSDRSTAGLFGDGAGAAVVSAGGPGRIGVTLGGSDTDGLECITATHSERLVRMDGRTTFRYAVAGLTAATRDTVAAAGLELGDIDVFVYHQANTRITAAVGERLGLDSERVIDCIAEMGNTSAASVPLALERAYADGLVRPGSRVLLAAFAAGFVWSTALVEWEEQS